MLNAKLKFFLSLMWSVTTPSMICTLRIVTALLIGLRSQSWFLTFWSNEVPWQFIYLDTNKTHLVGLAEDHSVFICVKNLSKRSTFPQFVQLILKQKKLSTSTWNQRNINQPNIIPFCRCWIRRDFQNKISNSNPYIRVYVYFM